MGTEKFNTNIDIDKFDRAEIVDNWEAMVVNGFYWVGPSQITGKLVFYTKCSGVDFGKYPQGLFLPTDGDATYWNAQEVFEDDHLKVWSLWPTDIKLKGDNR